MYKKILLTILAAATLLTSTTTADAACSYTAPGNSSFKSYMEYRTITARSTNQWKLRGMCNTSERGFRMYNGRYVIAIGTGYNAPAGTYVDVVLSSGKVLNCIVGDIKDDMDTDSSNKQCIHNNSVVEFLSDYWTMTDTTMNMGTVGILDGFEGDVQEIIVYNMEDMASMYWDFVIEGQEEDNKVLVTNKYKVDVGGHYLYFIEYASNDAYNTLEVDEETYYDSVINYSIIELE